MQPNEWSSACKESADRLAEDGEYYRAILRYSQALRINPSDSKAHLARGLAYHHWGSYFFALADYTEAIRLDPTDSMANVMRADFHYSKGNYDLAIADYTRAIDLDNNTPYTYGSRARAYLGKGDYEQAMADCAQALSLDPDDASAYVYRAQVHEFNKEHDEAIADSTKAISLDPRLGCAYAYRARSYECIGDYGRAIADYIEAILLDCREPWTYVGRGNAYFHNCSYDLAAADCTQAIRLDGALSVAYRIRGIARTRRKNYERAIIDLTEAIRHDPRDVLSHLSKGHAHYQIRQYGDAITHYTEAIRLYAAIVQDPCAYHADAGNLGATEADLYVHRGDAYLYNYNYDLAIGDYTEALRLDQRNAEAHYGRGLAYHCKGEPWQSDADFMEVSRLDKMAGKPVRRLAFGDVPLNRRRAGLIAPLSMLGGLSTWVACILEPAMVTHGRAGMVLGAYAVLLWAAVISQLRGWFVYDRSRSVFKIDPRLAIYAPNTPLVQFSCFTLCLIVYDFEAIRIRDTGTTIGICLGIISWAAMRLSVQWPLRVLRSRLRARLFWTVLSMVFQYPCPGIPTAAEVRDVLHGREDQNKDP
jgi:tetratricopeptide (TPR) repeat protein